MPKEAKIQKSNYIEKIIFRRFRKIQKTICRRLYSEDSEDYIQKESEDQIIFRRFRNYIDHRNIQSTYRHNIESFFDEKVISWSQEKYYYKEISLDKDQTNITIHPYWNKQFPAANSRNRLLSTSSIGIAADTSYLWFQLIVLWCLALGIYRIASGLTLALRQSEVAKWKVKFMAKNEVSSQREQLLNSLTIKHRTFSQNYSGKDIGSWIYSCYHNPGDIDLMELFVIKALTLEEACMEMAKRAVFKTRQIQNDPDLLFDEMKVGRNTEALSQWQNISNGEQGNIPDEQWRYYREELEQIERMPDGNLKTEARNRLEYSLVPLRWGLEDLLQENPSIKLPASNESVPLPRCIMVSERFMVDVLMYDPDTRLILECSNVWVCHWRKPGEEQSKPVSIIWRTSGDLFRSLMDQVCIYSESASEPKPVKAAKRLAAQSRMVLGSDDDVSLEAKELSGLILESLQGLFDGPPGKLAAIQSRVTTLLKALKLISKQQESKKENWTTHAKVHLHTITQNCDDDDLIRSQSGAHELKACWNKLIECTNHPDIFSDDVKKNLEEVKASLHNLIIMATEENCYEWRSFPEIARRLHELVGLDASIRKESEWKTPASDSEAFAKVRGVSPLIVNHSILTGQ